MDYLNDLAKSRKHKFKYYKLNPVRPDLKFHNIYNSLDDLDHEDNYLTDSTEFRSSGSTSSTFVYRVDTENNATYGNDFTVLKIVEIRKILDKATFKEIFDRIASSDKYRDRLEDSEDKEVIRNNLVKKISDEATLEQIRNVAADKIRIHACIIVIDKLTSRFYIQDNLDGAVNLLADRICPPSGEFDQIPLITIVPTELVNTKNYEVFLTSFYLNPFSVNSLFVGDKVQMGSSYLKVSATGAVDELDLLFDKVLEGQKVKELCIRKNFGHSSKKAVEDLEFSSSDGAEFQTFQDLVNNNHTSPIGLGSIATSVTVRSAKNNTLLVKNLSLLTIKKKAFEELEERSPGISVIFMFHALRMAYLTMNDCHEKFLTERADQLHE